MSSDPKIRTVLTPGPGRVRSGIVVPGRRVAWALALTLAWAASSTVAAEGGAAEAVASPAVPRSARIEDFAPPEEFLMVGPIKTHFVHKGETGRAVVLVHGFAGSTFTWSKTVEALAPRYRVYALDLKGFGLTAKPKDGQYHMGAYTAHLLGFLDALKLERPVLVGHSLGGAVVTRVALSHPDRVGGLVLVAPVPVTMPRDKDAMLRVGGAEARTAAEKAASLNPRLASRMIPALLRSTVTPQMVESALKVAYHDPKFVTRELVEICYRPITIDGAAEALASMAVPPPPPPAVPALDTLKVPALVAWGAHDAVVPHDAFEAYARSIPGARKLVLGNSGHLPHEEEADAFDAALIEFLGSLP